MNDKRLKENNKKIICFYTLSFAIPCIISFLAYCSLGIYPGGERIPIICDLCSEHLAYYNILNTIDSSCGSLIFQTMGGLGGSTLGSLTMYSGPFFLLSGFVETVYIPYAVYFIILALAGLSGLSAFVYLRKGYPSVNSLYICLLLSSCYALSSCTIVFFIVPVWMIGIALLPLVAYSLDRMILGQKPWMLIAVLTSSVILNYYTSYILFYFSVLYFIYRSVVEKLTLKEFISKAFMCLGCFAYSACLSAFLWLPVLLELLNGKGIEGRKPVLGQVRNVFEVASMVLPFKYSGLNRYDMPYIYCSIIPIILVVVYFLSSIIKSRAKIASAIFLLYLILSFSVGIFDISWMFFSEPNGYPSRYSFVFSFVVVMIAGCASKSISEWKVKQILRNILNPVITCVVFVDLLFNSIFVLHNIDVDMGGFADRREYNRVAELFEDLNDQYSVTDPFHRVVKNWRYASNDGILFGYPDIDYFSSSYNSSLHEFLGSLGLNEKYHMLRSDGITPPVANVLGVSKFIWYGELYDEYEFLGSFNGLNVYENNNCIYPAFSIEVIDDTVINEFGDDPFKNINTLMLDLTGVEDIYEIIPVDLNEDSMSIYAPEGKNIWLYADSSSGAGVDIHNDSSGRQYIYFNEVPICAYANDISPYCVELGTGSGEIVNFTFDGNIDQVYVAAYNYDNAQEAYSVLKQNEAMNFTLLKDGFGFLVNNDRSMDLILTYPYENGYEIYVDGVKTEYQSYRDALIKMNMDAGEHIVYIRYKPPGAVWGINFTIFSFIIGIILLFLTKKNVKFVTIREKLRKT